MIEGIYDLYMAYETNYKSIIINNSVDALTELATKYTAYDFFSDRNSIGIDMQKALDKKMKQCCYSATQFFQLRSVDLPDEFE